VNCRERSGCRPPEGARATNPSPRSRQFAAAFCSSGAAFTEMVLAVGRDKDSACGGAKEATASTKKILPPKPKAHQEHRSGRVQSFISLRDESTREEYRAAAEAFKQ
jgi:hypothetical protein